jgi:dTDP-glucose 4,6-dehydratase
MTHVLLTGASGFLGAHCLRKILTETDWTVTCPVTFRHRGSSARLQWAESVIADDDERAHRSTWVYQDLAESSTPYVLSQTSSRPDLILNFASETHPPRSITDPIGFTKNNHDLALHLLEYARTLPDLQAFIQISTDSVYGPAPGATVHHEWGSIIPNNPYSASKAAQEALVIAWWRSFGVPVSIVATMNPMGETQDTEKFIPMAIGKILRGERVQIHAVQNESGSRTFIDARQMLAGLWHVLDFGQPMMFDGTVDRPDRWNVVGARETTNLEVARIIADTLGRDLDYELVSVDRPAHGHRYAMSGTKLALSGWAPKDDIIGAIIRTTRWFAEHQEWLTCL